MKPAMNTELKRAIEWLRNITDENFSPDLPITEYWKRNTEVIINALNWHFSVRKEGKDNVSNS